MRRIPVAIFLAKDSALCCVVLTAYRFVMTHVWRVFPASLPLLSTRHKLYVFLRWGIRVFNNSGVGLAVTLYVYFYGRLLF